MSDQDILKKAIQKAIDGGWIGFRAKNIDGEKGDWHSGPHPVWFIDNAKYYEDIKQFASGNGTDFELEGLIFNHDFAKALWGEADKLEQDEIGGGKFTHYLENLLAWQYHLQMMVIAPDPIKYLGDHLND